VNGKVNTRDLKEGGFPRKVVVRKELAPRWGGKQSMEVASRDLGKSSCAEDDLSPKNKLEVKRVPGTKCFL